MRILRYGEPKRETPVAMDDEGLLFDLSPLTADIDGSFLAADGIRRAMDALAAGQLREIPGVADQRMAAPIARPSQVVCIGANYRAHIREVGALEPDEPVVFMKSPHTVVGPYDPVLVPRKSKKTDWEVELAVVIGTTARYLDSPDDADRCIAGYAISNDVSEREFQLERGGQWDKGKSCETFNPLGPYLVPAQQIRDVQNLSMRLWVNGELRQSSSTSDMLFDVRYIVWYLSQFLVLYPGDVINTGTPEGVAMGEANPRYLREGDVMELEIEGLGRQRQVLRQA